MNDHLDRLDQCATVFAPKLRAFHARAKAQGFELLIVRAYSSPAEQRLKYQQGRTLDRESGLWVVSDPALVVTDAAPGRSAHNIVALDGQPAALAADVIPLNPHGEPLWATPPMVWRALYRIAAHCGLDGYGDGWGAEKAGDPGHFEEPGVDDACFAEVLVALGLRWPTADEITASV